MNQLQTCKVNGQLFNIVNSKWQFSIQGNVLKIRKHPFLDPFYVDYELQIVNGEIQYSSENEFPKSIKEAVRKHMK